MADYETLEESVETSRPIEVYNFSLGTESFLYTSSEDEVTVGINTYTPEAISRGAIAQGDDDRDAILEIEIPAKNVFAIKYVDIVPGQRATCSIIRIQRDETLPFTEELIYKGFVQSVKFKGNGEEAVIGIRSLESSSSRPIPRFVYSGLCNHVLYDTGCGVNSDTFKLTGEVLDIDGAVLTLDGASGFADGHFNGGFIKPAAITDFRLILGHIGDELTLLLPFPTSLIGGNANVFAGCNHLISGHCLSRFTNVPDHGGFPYIPTVNPFESGID